MAKRKRRGESSPPILSIYQAGISESDDPFEQRLISIWPFLVKKAKLCYDRLKPVERSNLDLEDIISEMVATLKEYDDQFDPERGNYLTFASIFVRQSIALLRDRSRTVEAPRNAVAHAAKSEAGQSNPRCAKTLQDIVRTGETPVPIESIEVVDGNAPDPADLLSEGSRLAGINRDLAEVFEELTPKETFVIVRLFGLFGAGRMSESKVAKLLRATDADVCLIRNEALKKLKGFLNEEDYF